MSHAFIYSAGTLVELETLGGYYNFGNAINDAGEVAGEARGADGAMRAFVYRNGVMKVLSLSNESFGADAFATDINNAGQVVGSAPGELPQVGWTGLAFIHTNGRTYDLSKPTSGRKGFVLTTAFGINDAGQIVGSGFRWGEPIERGFLLTPIGVSGAR